MAVIAMANSEWRMGGGEWGAANGSSTIRHSPFAIRHLPRQHLDADKSGLTMRVPTFGVGLMLLHREAAGGAGNEAHLADRARLDLPLDVVAVQVQHDRPVAGPAQLDGITLLDADQA